MKDFINFDLKDINTELNNLAIQITTNNLGDGHLQNLKLSDTSSNNEIFLIRLIYHVAVMLSCKKYHKLFSPIAMIYENPQVLLGKLFPTMMDDQFLFTKSSMTDVGQWYQCPKGHPYFIGEVCIMRIYVNIMLATNSKSLARKGHQYINTFALSIRII